MHINKVPTLQRAQNVVQAADPNTRGVQSSSIQTLTLWWSRMLFSVGFPQKTTLAPLFERFQCLCIISLVIVGATDLIKRPA